MEKKELDDAHVMIAKLFPDEKERDELLQSALVRLHPEPPKGSDGRFSKPIRIADIVIEMLRIRRMRELVRLIVATQPTRMERVHSILGDCEDACLAEVAHIFGVAEATITNDWMPSGMPIN
jgi:hypothetical protein